MSSRTSAAAGSRSVPGGGGEGVRVQVQSLAIRMQEQAQQVDRVGLEDRGALDMQAAALGEEARSHLPPAGAAAARQETRQGARLGFDPLLLQLGGEDPGQGADLLGDQEVAPHEALHRRGVAAVAITHPAGDGRLEVEGQPLLGPASGEVHVAAHRPEKVDGAEEAGHLPAVEHVQLDDAAGPVGAGHGVQVSGDPEQGVEVPQPALALLDVGLDHIAAGAGAQMPLVPLLELGGHELRARAADHLIAEPSDQVLGQGFVSGQVAGFQDGGADGEVLPREAQALVHGPGGVANLEAQVPQRIEHELDHALGVGRLLVGPKEQQIEVGEGRQGPAAVASHRHQRQALALGRVPGPEDMDGGEVVEGADHLVGHAGQEAGGLDPAGAVLQSLLGDHPTTEESLAKDVEGASPLLGFVADGVQGCGGQPGAKADAVEDVFEPGRTQAFGHDGQI
jgi:hypothetical protein